MSPERLISSGPLTRALYEALESVAAGDQVEAIVELSLRAAALDEVPEDLPRFRDLVGDPLRGTVTMILGRAAAESVDESLAHVLRNATPQGPPRSASGPIPKALFRDEERDDPSGMRSVELPPAHRSASGFRLGTAGAAAVREMHEAPTQPPPPMSAPAESSRTGARDTGVRPQVLARASRPELRSVRSSSSSLTPPRALPLDVLVVTLDEQLVAATAQRLRGRARVEEVRSVGDLAHALGELRGQRLAVIVDTALSSINVPTFATLSEKLPPHTVVVLWGIDEMQQRRLAARFPQVRSWIAGGTSGTPADLLLDR